MFIFDFAFFFQYNSSDITTMNRKCLDTLTAIHRIQHLDGCVSVGNEDDLVQPEDENVAPTPPIDPSCT